MALINREKVITTVINRNLDIEQIKVDEIEAAEFKYIRGSLKEDLYEAIVASPFSTDPDFTTGIVNTLVKEVELIYSSGLTANSKKITGITNAAEAVFTIDGHGFSTGDVIYIAGAGAKTLDGSKIPELNKTLQHNKLEVTKVDVDTFKLTSNLVNDYLKPALAYYTVGMVFNKIYVEISDRGVKYLDVDHATTVDPKVRSETRADIFQIADALMGKALDYIHEQNFDDYKGSGDDEDEYESLVMRKGQDKRVTHF